MERCSFPHEKKIKFKTQWKKKLTAGNLNDECKRKIPTTNPFEKKIYFWAIIQTNLFPNS